MVIFGQNITLISGAGSEKIGSYLTKCTVQCFGTHASVHAHGNESTTAENASPCCCVLLAVMTVHGSVCLNFLSVQVLRFAAGVWVLVGLVI